MRNYVKKKVQPMEPWVDGYDMEGVSVGSDDAANGSPKQGDMIAHDPTNPSDRWLISSAFFASNYVEAPPA